MFWSLVKSLTDVFNMFTSLLMIHFGGCKGFVFTYPHAVSYAWQIAHFVLSNQSLHDLNWRQEWCKQIRPIHMFDLLFKGGCTEFPPDLLRLVFLGVLHGHHLLDNSNQDKRIKLQQMRINHLNVILHQRFYFNWCFGPAMPFNYLIW